MKVLAMAALVGLSLGSSKVLAQQQAAGGTSEAERKALMAQLEALKASYAQEVRRLRELDMQVQAMQARISGRAAAAAPPPQTPATPPPPAEGYASSAAEAEEAKEAARRSVDDVKQQQAALFNRKLIIENSLNYARYDRKQLTLNGFLALDAIFLGNIAIENVESDSLTYNLAARWGINPRLTLNVDVPYLARKTIYQKGGAGGSAAAIAQEETSGHGLGDITVSANYKLLPEHR